MLNNMLGEEDINPDGLSSAQARLAYFDHDGTHHGSA